MGTPTKNYEGGAEEEIDWYISNNKPAMIYFSDKPIAPSKLDHAQHEKLEAYKKKLLKKGLCGSYSSLEKLEIILSNHLDISMRNTKVVPKVDAQAVRRELKEDARSRLLNTSTPLKNQQTYLKRHTEKSFIICGPIALSESELTDLGGQYISIGKGNHAWNFGHKRMKQVADALHVEAVIRS